MKTVSPPSEREWLDRAVTVAAENVLTGGGPFGALVVKDGSFVLHDLKQGNPVTVNGTAVSGGHLVAVGDRIGIGSTILRLDPA